MLTKIYTVVDVDRERRIRKSFKTEEECVKYLNEYDAGDYLGTLTLTMEIVWTNNPNGFLKDYKQG